MAKVISAIRFKDVVLVFMDNGDVYEIRRDDLQREYMVRHVLSDFAIRR